MPSPGTANCFSYNLVTGGSGITRSRVSGLFERNNPLEFVAMQSLQALSFPRLMNPDAVALFP